MSEFDHGSILEVQAACGGVMLWGMFSRNTLKTLLSTGNCLNTTTFQTIVVDYSHPVMTTVYPSFNGCFVKNNVSQSSDYFCLVS